MKILVPIKRVTDPEIKIKINPDGLGIDLTGVNFKINPFDEIAVEEALRIKERLDGEVVIVCISSEASKSQIKTALSMGTDRAILVKTDNYVDSDAVARILKKIVDRENPDIVLMGKQAVDVDDNQVAQLLAGYLNWGQACFASRVEITDKKAIVHREVDGGIEIVEIDLPGIISTDLRLNEPRYPTLPAILKAKKKEIKEITLNDLGVDVTPKVEIIRFEEPPQRKAGRLVANIEELVSVLINDVKIV